MGEVYAGVDETLKRRVALKAIRAEHRLNSQAKARFLREAQILSHLDHPHICRVYNYVEGGDSDWLVLELIEGKTLHEAIARRPRRRRSHDDRAADRRSAGRHARGGRCASRPEAGQRHADRRGWREGAGFRPGPIAVLSGTPRFRGGGRRVARPPRGFRRAASNAAPASASPEDTRLPGPGELPTIASSSAERGTRDRGRSVARHAGVHEPGAGAGRGRRRRRATSTRSACCCSELFTGQPPYHGDGRLHDAARPRAARRCSASGRARRGPDPPHPAPEGVRARRAADGGGYARAAALDRRQAEAPRPPPADRCGRSRWRRSAPPSTSST